MRHSDLWRALKVNNLWNTASDAVLRQTDKDRTLPFNGMFLISSHYSGALVHPGPAVNQTSWQHAARRGQSVTRYGLNPMLRFACFTSLTPPFPTKAVPEPLPGQWLDLNQLFLFRQTKNQISARKNGSRYLLDQKELEAHVKAWGGLTWSNNTKHAVI